MGNVEDVCVDVCNGCVVDKACNIPEIDENTCVGGVDSVGDIDVL